MKDREEFVATPNHGRNCKCSHDEWYHNQWFNPSNTECSVCGCKKLDIVEKVRTSGTEQEREKPVLREVPHVSVDWQHTICSNEREVCKLLSNMKFEYSSAAKVFKQYSDWNGVYFTVMFPCEPQVDQ